MDTLVINQFVSLFLKEINDKLAYLIDLIIVTFKLQ